MGLRLRWGRRCNELLSWSLAPTWCRAEGAQDLITHQGILTQHRKTLAVLSRAVTHRTRPKSGQKKGGCLSTSQSGRLTEQSTFGACINRTVDDRLFGLSEEESQLRATIQQFCKREIRPLAEVSRESKDKDKPSSSFARKIFIPLMLPILASFLVYVQNHDTDEN